jgi:muramoyltetrapeptide carboxypeptidase
MPVVLAPGARIAVVAPSGAYDPARLQRGQDVLDAWGYRPERMPGCGSAWRYLAGSDAARLNDLERAFSGEYDAVWMARGGSGLGRLLRQLRFDGLAPVPLLGFSDGTALLNPLAALGRPAVHAPVLTHLGDTADEASRARLRDLLAGTAAPLEGLRPLVPGRAHGPVRGGNLCVLASLCGTPWQLDARGAIVLLEEVGEAPYRVDRMLRQLLDSGSLEGAAAIVVGELQGARPPDGADWTMDDVLRDCLGGLGIPVHVDAPVGHGARNWPVPFVDAALEDGRLAFGARRA